jgi:hypothetical protein
LCVSLDKKMHASLRENKFYTLSETQADSVWPCKIATKMQLQQNTNTKSNHQESHDRKAHLESYPRTALPWQPPQNSHPRTAAPGQPPQDSTIRQPSQDSNRMTATTESSSQDSQNKISKIRLRRRPTSNDWTSKQHKVERYPTSNTTHIEKLNEKTTQRKAAQRRTEIF